MSVNEVKLQIAPMTLEVRGTGAPTNRTFAIGNEDHTLGNSLRHVLVNNAKVGFAGYSVPHPSEPVVHIRVQTHKGSDVTALDALQEACETLVSQCQVVLDKLEQEVPEIKTDRAELAEKLRLMDEEQEEDEDEEGEGMEVIEEDGDGDVAGRRGNAMC